jgi:Tol biopolymer transport system component
VGEEVVQRPGISHRRRFAVLVGVSGAIATGLLGLARESGAKPFSDSGLPRNGRIAFVDSTGGLISVNPDGSARRLLAGCGQSAATCSIRAVEWSPNGRRLLFFRSTTRDAYSLYVVDADGRHLRRLAVCGYRGLLFGSRATWSPSGSEVAFVGKSGLAVVDVRRRATRQLTQCSSSCGDRSPAWSPDGSRIAFARGDSIYTVSADGSSITKLASAERFANDPVWSPDGRRIAFDGVDTIYVVGEDGSGRAVILDGTPGSGPGVPTWSPDGTRILYFNTPGTPGAFSAEVWTMSPDGSNRRRLYGSPCCVYDWSPPIWAPNGDAIAFSANSAGGVVVMNSDGSHLRTLSGRTSDLAWQSIR